MRVIFHHHPDGWIIFHQTQQNEVINNVVIPLSLWLEWEPDYQPLLSKDGGLENTLEVTYSPGEYRTVKAKNGRYLDMPGDYPLQWADGDRYISKLQVYIDATLAVQNQQTVKRLPDGSISISPPLSVSKDKVSILPNETDELTVTVSYPFSDVVANAVWIVNTPERSEEIYQSTLENGSTTARFTTDMIGLHHVRVEIDGVGVTNFDFFGYDGGIV